MFISLLREGREGRKRGERGEEGWSKEVNYLKELVKGRIWVWRKACLGWRESRVN